MRMPMEQALKDNIDRFLEKIQKNYSPEDALAIQYACDFGAKAHDGQKRLSGEDYYFHPLAVADILVDMGLDTETIIAGLLHDVIEDTEVTEEQLKSKFGASIFELVEAVTKLTRISFHSTEVEQAENIRKLFFAMSKDIRVLLVKLADRLHNMRTLDFLPHEKQIKKSKETLDIYAPLAGRLGISWIKCEMEDLSMKYLFPEDYAYLVDKLKFQRDERMKLVNKVSDELSAALKDINLDFEIKGRPKHIYSIYKKMKDQNKTFEQIYDLIAVRVIVDNIGDCYTVLGIIHSMWKPIPGRFKDYIASPKPNMYQSLHTTIVTNFGQIFEIQIRTVEMNRVAEYGIAAHWRYKEGASGPATEYDRKLGFIKEVMDVQGDLRDSLEFIDTLKTSVSTNEIYVFTPKGDVFDLPVNSTCIDFAYRIHTEIGNKCTGAKINGQYSSPLTILQNGDVVEVITQNNAKPSRDWLKHAVTPTAKAKIRSYFKKMMKDDNVKLGREMLEREAARKGRSLGELMTPGAVKYVLNRYNFADVDDMFATVGFGGLKTNQILFKFIDYDRKLKETEGTVTVKTVSDTMRRRSHSGILIDGYDDFLIRLAKCCNPVPGDKIIGYISRGRGVTVHRADCPNMKPMEPQRLMAAQWANVDDSFYNAPLYIECENAPSYLSKITSLIANMGYSISSLNAHANKGKDRLQVNIGLEIKQSADLAGIIKRIEGIKGVYKVQRGF